MSNNNSHRNIYIKKKWYTKDSIKSEKCNKEVFIKGYWNILYEKVLKSTVVKFIHPYIEAFN